MTMKVEYDRFHSKYLVSFSDCELKSHFSHSLLTVTI